MILALSICVLRDDARGVCSGRNVIELDLSKLHSVALLRDGHIGSLELTRERLPRAQWRLLLNVVFTSPPGVDLSVGLKLWRGEDLYRDEQVRFHPAVKIEGAYGERTTAMRVYDSIIVEPEYYQDFEKQGVCLALNVNGSIHMYRVIVGDR